jgi:hypothetical protein
MARVPELEAILQAWFDLETCASSEHFSRKRRLEELVDAAIASSTMKNVSRRDLLAALRDQYREFAKAKHIEQRKRLSRLK